MTAAKIWADPEKRAKMIAAQSEGAKRRWADPEKREALLAARAVASPRKPSAPRKPLTPEQRAERKAEQRLKSAKRWSEHSGVPLDIALTVPSRDRRKYLRDLNWIPSKASVKAAAKYGIPIEQWLALSKDEKLWLKRGNRLPLVRRDDHLSVFNLTAAQLAALTRQQRRALKSAANVLSQL